MNCTCDQNIHCYIDKSCPEHGIDQIKSSLLPVQLPEFNRPVRAVIKSPNFQTKKWSLCELELIAVDESDLNWRFVDDGAELSYWVDVIYWEYIGEG